MTAPKFIEVKCPRCGGRGRQVNGAWLRELRMRASLSGREVARRLGFSAPYICDIELGRRNPPARVIDFYEGLR